MIIFTVISLLLKLLFTFLYVEFDINCYLRIKEQQIDRGHPVAWFWYIIFWRTELLGHEAVPIYRVLANIFMFGYWFVVYKYFLSQFATWIVMVELGSVLLAYYFMVFEFLYYYLSEADVQLFMYEIDNTDTYWLKRIWFSGFWLFREETGRYFKDNGYRRVKFQISCLTGLVLMGLGSFVFLL